MFCITVPILPASHLTSPDPLLPSPNIVAERSEKCKPYLVEDSGVRCQVSGTRNIIIGTFIKAYQL
jgi:hypothetical protein